MKLVFTSVIGFGIGYDYKVKEISIHLGIWCLEISLQPNPNR